LGGAGAAGTEKEVVSLPFVVVIVDTRSASEEFDDVTLIVLTSAVISLTSTVDEVWELASGSSSESRRAFEASSFNEEAVFTSALFSCLSLGDPGLGRAGKFSGARSNSNRDPLVVFPSVFFFGGSSSGFLSRSR
jgi:hypothetical protein